MATKAQEELGIRLRNWGTWVRGFPIPGEARNGIWASTKTSPTFVDDAEQVEFCITSWRQGPKSVLKRFDIDRRAFILKLYYSDIGTIDQKRKDYQAVFRTDLAERTFYNLLNYAERDLAALLPPPVGPIVEVIKELQKKAS